MENQSLFKKARESASNLDVNEIQSELNVLFTLLIFTHSKNIFECINRDEFGNVYRLSEGGKLFISYLKDKYLDECKCLTIFNKALHINFNLDPLNPDFKQFFDGAEIVFSNKFSELNFTKPKDYAI